MFVLSYETFSLTNWRFCNAFCLLKVCSNGLLGRVYGRALNYIMVIALYFWLNVPPYPFP